MMVIDVVIDLSHWQTAVDFVAIKNAGIIGVILKATQGSTWVDPTFVSRMTAAHSVGLLIGAYHFADASDPMTQATHFLSIASAAGRLVIDIEPNGMGNTVSIPQAAEIVARVQSATSRLPAVYISRYGSSGNGAGLPNSVLSRCPLWLPEYGMNPIPPPGWTNWMLWQYTQTGRVEGIGSPCDRSRFSGTLDDLTTWWTS